MTITALPTRLTLTSATVKDYIATFANKQVIAKVEVVTGGTPTDVTVAVSNINLNLHKNSTSSFAFLIQDIDEASFPMGDEVRVWFGYKISGTDHFFKAFVGNIKRKVHTHISKINAMTVTGFGVSYKLLEATGTNLVVEKVVICTVTVTVVVDEETMSSSTDILGDKDVPERYVGKARGLVQRFLDASGIVYTIDSLDYDIDVQVNFETAQQLIQHVLSLASEPIDWWDGLRATHIERRKTVKRRSASPSTGIEYISAATNVGTGTLSIVRAAPCLNVFFKWTAPGDLPGLEVVIIGTLLPGGGFIIKVPSRLFSRDASMYLGISTGITSGSITISEDATPIPIDITLSGTQFSLFERDKSGQIESGHTSRFLTPYSPYIKIDSVVRLSNSNIGTDRDILIDAISIKYSWADAKLEMDCKGEVL